LENGPAASYSWSLVSGPNSPTFSTANAQSTQVSGFEAGNYVFRLSVVATNGTSASNNVKVTVNPAQVITISAGPDQTITLPTSSVTLNGAVLQNGPASSYTWTLVNGPTTPVFATAAASSTLVSGLQAGVYIFRLSVTGTNGTSANNTVKITVVGGSSVPLQGGYHRSIVIDHTKVYGNSLTSFPVLISGTFDYLKSTSYGGKVADATGRDIQFSADSLGTTPLNWEIEKYNQQTGEFVAWVSTDISSLTDKRIYLHYGDAAGISINHNATNTWKSAYASVYHMGNDGVPDGVDATMNGNNGSVIGASGTSGKINLGAQLGGNSQYIDIGNRSSLGITNDITLQAWINPNDYANYNGIIAKTAAQFPKPYDFYLDQHTGIPKLYRGNGTVYGYGFVQGQQAPPTNTWSHIAVTISGNTVTHYLNGQVNGVGELPASGTGANGTDKVYIGTRSDFATALRGRLDEVRILNESLSANWIKTEYNNQLAPANFYTISEEIGTAPVVPVVAPFVNAGTDFETPGSEEQLHGTVTETNQPVQTILWSQVSGPSTVVFSTPNRQSPRVSGMVGGVYVLRLTATDITGVSASDDIVITVHQPTAPTPTTFYRAITVRHQQVSNVIQGQFPMLISGTYPYLRSVNYGGKVSNDNGFDILFTNDVAALSKLNWEVEKYNPQTGELVAWVNVDVSPVQDRVIYMHYGDNSIVSFQGNVNGTWNNNYMTVHHLANGSTLAAIDATSHHNNGAINGATAGAGVWAGCADFNGMEKSINLGTGASLGVTGDITLEAWIRPLDFSTYNGIISKTAGHLPKPYDFYLLHNSGLPQLYRGNGSSYSSVSGSVAPPVGQWSHIAVTISGNIVRHYLNGALNGVGVLDANSPGGNGNDPVLIGSRNDHATQFRG
ncbi:MAG: hypothetical protein EOO88_31555, partial [Pedobacter sp.]